MKKTIFSLALVAFSAFSASAQFIKFGLKGGIQTTHVQPGDLVVTNPQTLDQLQIKVQDAKNGFHFGAYTKIGRTIFLQPELVFNSNSVDYKINEVDAGDVIKNEKYQYLDVPILVGLKLGPLRLNGGPVGHYFMSSKSELLDVQGYEQVFKKSTWGGQLGFGINLGKHLTADFRYEANFSKFGDHFEFFGQQYSFDQNPSRLMASVGWTF